MMNNNKKANNMEATEALITILKQSHAQAMAGQIVTMEEVECFMNKYIANPIIQPFKTIY